MNRKKKERLEQAGFRVGDAEDFLELTEEERQLVALRVAISRTIRDRRQEADITQEELANRIASSQSRIAKIEAGTPGVSLDLSSLALFALGGKVADLCNPPKRRKRRVVTLTDS